VEDSITAALPRCSHPASACPASSGTCARPSAQKVPHPPPPAMIQPCESVIESV